MKKQSGFTLIELMISLALGVAISWVVLDVSLNAMRNSRDIVATGDVMEKGLYLGDLLKREIKNTGFYGRVVSAKMSGDAAPGMCSSTPTLNHLRHPLYGINNVSSQQLCSGDDLLEGSDVLMIRRASTAISPNSLVANQHYVQSNFNTVNIATGTAANFSLKEMDGTVPAPIHQFYHDVYYVDNYKNFKRRRFVNGSHTIEPLIEGVDDFQLEFAYDTDNDNIADSFGGVPTTTENWRNTKTVTVSLLISGQGVSQNNTIDYAYAGETKSFSDGKKRRLFSFVVAIGNQF